RSARGHRKLIEIHDRKVTRMDVFGTATMRSPTSALHLWPARSSRPHQRSQRGIRSSRKFTTTTRFAQANHRHAGSSDASVARSPHSARAQDDLRAPRLRPGTRLPLTAAALLRVERGGEPDLSV